MKLINNKIAGIFFTEGELWHEQRRFTLRYLRDFGFGRRFQSLEIDIQDELNSFIDMVKYGPKYPHEEVVAIQSVLLKFVYAFILNFFFLKGLCERWLYSSAGWIESFLWQLFHSSFV